MQQQLILERLASTEAAAQLMQQPAHQFPPVNLHQQPAAAQQLVSVSPDASEAPPVTFLTYCQPCHSTLHVWETKLGQLACQQACELLHWYSCGLRPCHVAPAGWCTTLALGEGTNMGVYTVCTAPPLGSTCAFATPQSAMMYGICW